MAELKPCPFCGGTDFQVVNVYCEDYYVECLTCTTCGPSCETDEEAIEAWNRRKGEPMKELIDRNALIAEYDRVHIGPPGGARKLMEDAPAAVVHCKDCKHWYKSKEFSPFGWCCQRNDIAHVSYRDRTEPEDFCSKGERRCE